MFKLGQLSSVALLAALVHAAPPAALPAAHQPPQAEIKQNGNATTLAHGETYFTADGYYHTDCTGNKYWSYEVSQFSTNGDLTENQEIGSVWIHDYGTCKSGYVTVQQYTNSNCIDGLMSTQYTSRGTCLSLQNDGWGAYCVSLYCYGK